MNDIDAITKNKKATAVLQDADSYQREQQALLLLKFVARGDQDYRENKILPDKDTDDYFRARLAVMRSND